MKLPQKSYIGRHAELYDLFYAEKPYREESEFIHHCLQTYGKDVKNVLELACGTGTHALMLEKFGYKINATDYSSDMLDQAQKKGKSSNSRVKFQLKDMRDLETPQNKWDAVVCLFDSIGYVATNENIQNVLNGVRRQLNPGGLFIFEFWHAAAMLKNYDPLRVRHWQIPDGEIVRTSETSIDYVSQSCSVLYTIYELMNNGRYQTIKETQINRFFLVQEMAQFLKTSNFFPLKWFSGFKKDEAIDSSVWHIVCVASAQEKEIAE